MNSLTMNSFVPGFIFSALCCGLSMLHGAIVRSFWFLSSIIACIYLYLLRCSTFDDICVTCSLRLMGIMLLWLWPYVSSSTRVLLFLWDMPWSGVVVSGHKLCTYLIPNSVLILVQFTFPPAVYEFPLLNILVSTWYWRYFNFGHLKTCLLLIL